MNHGLFLVVLLVLDWAACLRGRGRAGAWSHCTAARPRGLSMNLPGHRIAACRGKAALKTHALQTLTRHPLTRPEREAFGVRPIYRRFRSGAGLPAVQGPNTFEKANGRFSKAFGPPNRVNIGILLCAVHFIARGSF